MSCKKLIRKVHLWLGLSSGLIVLLLGITVCILAFEIELRNLTEPYKFVKEENRPRLPPTAFKKIADKTITEK